MDRRSFFLALAGGVVATTALGAFAAEAAPLPVNTNDLGGVRAALGDGPVEMQRGRGGGRGGFRGGGMRGGGFRGGFRGGGFRRGPGWGWRRRGWGGPVWGGPPRRCFFNRWGEWVCRRPVFW